MKRVLIITYYWPPNGGAGVQRWLKFAKYLPEFGWQPVVYTPQDPELIIEDAALEKDVPAQAEVIRRPIMEPYRAYKLLTGRRGEKVHTGFLSEQKGREGFLDRVAIRVRGNFFIPDARVAWVKPSVRFLKRYLHEHPVDVIASTGPPHSMHLIAQALRKEFDIPWIADFRDPWTNIDFYHQLGLSKRSDAKHKRLERSVLRQADRTIAVGWTLAEELRALGAKDVEVITNGFDPDDITDAHRSNELSLVHVGSLNAARNVPELWNALGELCANDETFKNDLILRFVGAVDHSALSDIQQAGLADRTQRLGTVDHARAIAEMQRARVLLLSLNDTPNAKGILTSKVFEYLAVGRPILAIGPKDGDIARVLQGTNAMLIERGEKIDRDKLAALFRQGPSAAPLAWSRKALTQDLVSVLNGLAARHTRA